MKKLLIALIISMLTCFNAHAAGQKRVSLQSALLDAHESLAQELELFEKDIIKASRTINSSNLNSPKSIRVLSQLCRRHSWLFGCPSGNANKDGSPTGEFNLDCKLEKRGKVIKKIDEASDQNIFRLLPARRCGQDRLIKEMIWVLPGPDNSALNTISLYVNPERLISDTAAPIFNQAGLEFWVMEKRGRIIYHSNRKKIGLNIFMDQAFKPFPELQIASGKMIDQSKGSCSFDYLGTGRENPSMHIAQWITVNWFDSSFIIVACRPVETDENTNSGLKAETGAPSAPEELHRLSEDARLRRFLESGQSHDAFKIVDQYNSAAPDVYLLQLPEKQPKSTKKKLNLFQQRERDLDRLFRSLEQKKEDEQGRLTVGSILSDPKLLKTKDFQEVIEDIANGKPASIRLRMPDGEQEFLFVSPIYAGERYLGLVYSIKVDPESPAWLRKLKKKLSR